MKKIIFTFVLLFSLPAYSIEAKEEHSININGIGEVEVAVDNVMINAGVDTRDHNLNKAKDDNQKRYSTLLAVLEKNGVDKAAIKSNFISITPVYVACYATQDNPRPKCDVSKIDYYEVNRGIVIKLDNLEKFDALIAGLSEAGGNNVNAGQYGVSNITKYRDQARDMAIDAARSKAEKIAKKLGVVLGKPIHFDTYDGSAESPIRPMAVAKMANMAVAASAPATDTETLGKIKVVVNVNIAYGIE